MEVAGDTTLLLPKSCILTYAGILCESYFGGFMSFSHLFDRFYGTNPLIPFFVTGKIIHHSLKMIIKSSIVLTQLMIIFFAFLFLSDFRYDHTEQTNMNILSKEAAIMFLWINFRS